MIRIRFVVLVIFYTVIIFNRNEEEKASSRKSFQEDKLNIVEEWACRAAVPDLLPFFQFVIAMLYLLVILINFSYRNI